MAEEPAGAVSGSFAMPLKYLRHVKDALGWLKPHEVRQKAERTVRVGLFAESDLAFFRMESFFAPPHWSSARREESARILQRAEPDTPDQFDIEIWSEELRRPQGAITFSWRDPGGAVRRAIREYEELAIPLSRHLEPFRRPAASHVIAKIARENALFAVATALPDVVPLLTFPWAAGEFASDTAVLTANQIRMAFMLGAASNRDIGYREQRNEIGSIIAGAFGWRALARELVGKIPFGGGLIPKAAIAWAGTEVVGRSLERYYRIGYGYTPSERKAAYQDALERGRQIATSLIESVRRKPE
ncbi:MAG: hypothetical protein ABSH47_19145 [Bryobacteraceae bacterium]|jgi:uncharacterized protein (DUF697 family)